MRPVPVKQQQEAMPRNMRPPLAQEMRQAEIAAPNEDARHRACFPVINARKDEITLTMCEITADKWLRRRLHNALVGREYDSSTKRYQQTRTPLFDGVQLQSLLRDSSGKYMDITYRSGMERVNNAELKDIRMLYGPGAEDDIRLCRVDPETGMFLEKLPVIEALKCMREHGENFRRPRWARVGTNCVFAGEPCSEKKPHAHDRWIVRDVKHHELYGKHGTATRDVVPRTVVSSSEPVRLLSLDEAVKVRSPAEAEAARG